jgi:UDP-N-acetylmuramoyl-tripeptide--D-alanyl-D-alanine ligase
MLELGSEEEAAHRRVGERAARLVDVLITVGPRSRTTARAARRGGLAPDHVLEADTLDEVIDRLGRCLRPGDDVLVKGSLAMGMHRVVAELTAGVGAGAA